MARVAKQEYSVGYRTEKNITDYITVSAVSHLNAKALAISLLVLKGSGLQPPTILSTGLKNDG